MGTVSVVDKIDTAAHNMVLMKYARELYEVVRQTYDRHDESPPTCTCRGCLVMGMIRKEFKALRKAKARAARAARKDR